MKRFLLQSCCIACLLLVCLAAAPAAGQELLTSFRVTLDMFSPDGDGDADTTSVTYRLAVDSVAVSIVVFEDDSATVVDTVVTATNQMAGFYRYGWDGTDYSGVPVVEEKYILRFHAQKNTQDTTIVKPLWIDVTAPRLVFQQRVPPVYVPGVPTQPQIVQVVFDVFNSTAPGGVPAGDLLSGIANFIPTGAASPDTVIFVPPFAGDGLYTAHWSVTKTVFDGFYSIKIFINDNASHGDTFAVDVDVDAKKPDIGVTSPGKSGLAFSVIPDSLHGWIWDRHSLDMSSLSFRFADSSPRLPLQSLHLEADTLLFSVPLADSIVDEREWTLFFEATDLYERFKSSTFKITYDATPLPAPTLNPFSGVTHGREIDLTGTWEGSPDLIRIYRNGALIDSVFSIIPLIKDINIRVPLELGRNTFTATAIDGAGNESPHSNAVEVVFDDATGLYIPAPFRPGDEFHLNLARPASRVTLRLYDLGGDLVVALNKFTLDKNYAFTWDGRNGSGEDVKKGPLVGVAEVVYEDGQKKVIREIFLFEPGK